MFIPSTSPTTPPDSQNNPLKNIPRLVRAFLLGSILACTTLATPGQTQLTLTWDPSPTPEVGYNLYYGTASGSYSTKTGAGAALSVTVSNLTEGTTYYFAATAVDSQGMESDYSAELVHTTAIPNPPPVINSAPVISAVPDQTIPADGATPAISFTVDDAQTTAASLTVVAESSNVALVPDANIYLGGTGNNRTVQVFPFAGMSGTATISLRVSDGELSAATSFVLNVEALRLAPPEITIAASSGSITAPFVLSGAVVSQSVATTVEAGGRAVYDFTVQEAGNYTVSIMVQANTSKNNALYVNVDAPPQETYMIWDMPVTKTFAHRTVAWRGTGTERKPQFSPKIFSLSAGAHQLVIVGREPQTKFSEIKLVPSTAPVAAASLSLASFLPPVTETYLSLDEVEGGLLVSWPTGSTAWMLEESSSPDQTTWSAVAGAQENDGLTSSVVVPAKNNGSFYRLRQN